MNEIAPSPQESDLSTDQPVNEDRVDSQTPSLDSVSKAFETEPERRTFRGLVGIGLAASSLFLGACARNGVEHTDPKAEILVSCDVSDLNNLPNAEVRLDGGDYGTGGSQVRTITHGNGDEPTRIDTFQAFNVSCIERRPDGVVISQKMPRFDIGVPGNDWADSLQYWQLDSSPDVAAHVSETREVKYVITVRPDEESADGFSVSSLHLAGSFVNGDRGSATEGNDDSIRVDLSRLSDPNSVHIKSVTVSDGPGVGQFGWISMHNGVEYPER